MALKPAPVLPPDVTVTLLGRDRVDIADALRDRANNLRGTYSGRRAQTEWGKMAHEKADRLCRLADFLEAF